MRTNRKVGRLRVACEKSDFNPMDGMANLADVMLVFAAGLLMALIMNWNVDVNTKAAPDDANKYEVNGVGEGQQEEIKSDKNLEELGKVYKDPETGKYYVVEGK